MPWPGADAAWDEVPGFWSKIGSHTLKYAAWGDGFDDARLVEHGGGAFTIWYTRDGVAVGVLTHERDADYERGRAAHRAGRTPVTISPLRAIVVVPARDEEERIGACLLALAGQRGHRSEQLRGLPRSRSLPRRHPRPRARVGLGGAERLTLTILDSLIPGVGHARRAGMDAACRRLLDAGVPDGLIATTDADSRVAADWLAVQLELAAAGARAIGGRIELDPHEAALLPPGVLASRHDQARERLASIRAASARRRDWLRALRAPPVQRRVARGHRAHLPARSAVCPTSKRSRTRRCSGCSRSAASRSCAATGCG